MINRDNVTQLTKNGLRDLMEKRKKKVILQVLEIQKLGKKDGTTASGNSDKYRVVISDGDAKFRCILGNEAAKIADQVDLKEYSVIQIVDNLLNNNEGKQAIIIITQIEVIHPNITEQIGNPIEWSAFSQGGYQNPAGSNQIPQKFLSNVGGNAPVKPMQNNNAPNYQPRTAPVQQQQPQTSAGGRPAPNNSISNQLMKNNSAGSFGQSNNNSYNQNQGTMNSRAGVGSSTAASSYNNNNSFNSNNNQQNNNRGSYGNKAVSYSTPHKKLSELSLDDFMPIRALVGFNTSFTIKAKVTKKTPLRTYNKNGAESHVFSIDLADHDGGEIQGSFFGDAAVHFHAILTENEVYAFSGGTVKMANRKFQTVDNDYQIFFDMSSQIERVDDDGSISVQNFKFMKIDQIEEVAVNTNCDIVALVKEVGPCSEIQLKSREMKARRILEFYDETKKTIELTLWGDTALNCNPQANDVIIGRGLRVSEFNGKKNLSFSAQTSQLFWGDTLPQIAEVQDLLNWKANNNIQDSDLQQISKAGDRPTRFVKTLEQVEEETANMSDERKYFTVRAHVAHIKTDNKMYYPSCPNEKCMKKLVEDGNSNWTCYACSNQTFDMPKWTYTLSVKIEDSSNCIWATAFRREAEIILQEYPAETLKQIKESSDSEAKLVEIVKQAQRPEWKLTVMAKQEYNNGEAATRYQIIRCLPMDFNYESKALLKMLDLYEQQ